MSFRNLFLQLITILFLNSGSAVGQIPAAEPSDVSEPPQKTGIIRGRVVASDTEGALNKATLVLRLAEGGRREEQPLTAKTNERGEYQFKNVKPAKYNLTASRNGYVRQTYGQKQSEPMMMFGFSAGTPILVRPGETLSQIDFKLIRGGVVEGRVLDQDNEPLSRVMVQMGRYSNVQGKRRLVPAGMGQTDDRGYYRLFDIPPGNYYLSSSFFGMPEGGQSAFPPTFYPGVLSPQEATKIQVTAGGEVSGMDIVMIEALSYNISGKVVNLDGKPAHSVYVMAMKQTAEVLPMMASAGNMTDLQGRFKVANLIPGRYRILAHANGVARKEENGELVPGATVIVFSTNPERRGSHSRFTKSGQTDQEGGFSIKGIVPGEHAVCAVINHEPGSEMDPDFLKEIEKRWAKRIHLDPNQMQREDLVAYPSPAAE